MDKNKLNTQRPVIRHNKWYNVAFWMDVLDPDDRPTQARPSTCCHQSNYSYDANKSKFSKTKLVCHISRISTVSNILNSSSSCADNYQSKPTYT